MSQINSYAKSNKNDLCEGVPAQVVSHLRSTPYMSKCAARVSATAGIFQVVSTSN